MRARRIWAVARKEGIHIVRDWRSLVMGIAIPILLLILFGYALTLDVDRGAARGLGSERHADQPQLHEPLSRDRPILPSVGIVQTYAEVERAIDAGEALVALVIPSRFRDGCRVWSDCASSGDCGR
jgi:ABC-2 type transport system permease protein